MTEFVRALTSTGRSVLITALLAVVVSLASGWAEFAVLAFGCLLAIGVGAIWIGRPQRLGVHRTLHPPKVTVGESAIGIIQVQNTTRRRMGPRVAEDILGDQVVRMALPALAPGETLEHPYTVPARTRGLFDVGPVRLTRSDPLGLFRRVQGQGSIEQLWVRPRHHKFATISSGWAKDLDGPTSDTAPRGSAAFHALREYQHGDDLRHIHWRTSARTNTLMVRHFVDTRRSQELVILDTRSEVYTDATFEEAVEFVASVCMAAKNDDRPVRLLLPGQGSALQDERYELLDRLALVHPTSGTPIDDLFLNAKRVGAGSSALVVVTGDSAPEDLIQRARHVQRTGLVVVVRVVEGSAPSVFSAAGGRVVNVSSAEHGHVVWAEAVTRS